MNHLILHNRLRFRSTWVMDHRHFSNGKYFSIVIWNVARITDTMIESTMSVIDRNQIWNGAIGSIVQFRVKISS